MADTEKIEGHTYFMRCGVCRTMCEPVSEGISLRTGSAVGPFWRRPKSIRKPIVCEHPQDRIEMWADGEWRKMPYTKGEE